MTADKYPLQTIIYEPRNNERSQMLIISLACACASKTPCVSFCLRRKACKGHIQIRNLLFLTHSTINKSTAMNYMNICCQIYSDILCDFYDWRKLSYLSLEQFMVKTFFETKKYEQPITSISTRLIQ